MYQAIGVDTKKLYKTGTKAECIRYLNSRYPSYTSGKKKAGKEVLPELVFLHKVN